MINTCRTGRHDDQALLAVMMNVGASEYCSTVLDLDLDSIDR